MVFDDFVNTTTRDDIVPMVADTILRSNILSLRLMMNPEQWTGAAMKVPIKYAKSTSGGSFQGYDVFSTQRANTRTNMTFNIKGIYQSVVLSNMEKAVNNTRNGVLDLVKLEMESAQDDMIDTLGDQIYGDGTGNSSKDITGLAAAVDDGTVAATYGGLSRSTYTTIQSSVTLAATTLTLAKMATTYAAITEGADHPTIMVTTPAVWNFYEQLLQPTVRANYDSGGFAQVTSTANVQNRGGLKGDSGFDAVWYRGCPVVADRKCPTGFLYFLNEKYLNWYSLPHPDDERSAIIKQNQIEGFYSNEKLPAPPVISWTGWKVPVNQDAVIGQMILYGELINSNPRRSGVIQGITSV